MSSPPLPPHLDPRGKHRGGGSRIDAARPVGRVLGSLVSIALLVLAGYFWYTFREIDRGVTRLEIAVGAAPSNAPTFVGKAQNILLVGNDDRSNMTPAEIKTLHTGRGDGSNSTDTMMIVHIPADGSKATLVSLPRDSYVKIPGYQMGKLNAAYVDGFNEDQSTTVSHKDRVRAGANLLIKTVGDLTGLTIDHYIQVSLLGFYEISNAIGGVPINLCHDVNDTVAYNLSIGGSGGSGFKMTAGKHTISGVQALEFVRQRHNFPGDTEDLSRVRRQQYFLTAAFRQVASVGILTKLRAVGEAIKRNVYLDGGLSLTDLATQLENLTANNITGKTIPTKNATLDDGTSILQVSPTKVRKFIEKIVNKTDSLSSASSTPTTSTSTTVPAGGSASTTTKPALDSKCIN